MILAAENDSTNILTLLSLLHSCGVDFPIFIELDQLLKLYSTSYHPWP